MPDRGLLEATAIHATPLGGAYPAPWEFTGARWAQLTYEVDQRAALGALPGDVARPVPCYARLFVLEADASPAGPLRLAALLTGGRYRMMPRNVLTDLIVEGPADDVSAAFGASARAGVIAFRRDGELLEVSVADSSGPLAAISLPALRAVEPGMLRWDAWLGFAASAEGPQLVEFQPEPNPTEAFLSKGGQLLTPPSLARTHTWRAFRNLNTVSACYEQGTLRLTAPVVQQSLT